MLCLRQVKVYVVAEDGCKVVKVIEGALQPSSQKEDASGMTVQTI